MKTKIFRALVLLFFNAFVVSGVAQDLKFDSFTESLDDLTANTQPVFDFNNNKAALIKIALPDKTEFEGNVLQSQYKTNEYYVYVSPGTKILVLKYPGVETLRIQLSDYLDGQGVVGGHTYRLKVNLTEAWKAYKFIVKAYADVGLGNTINAQSAIPLSSKKFTGNNFGLDLGYNVWQNKRNSISINLGVGFSPFSLALRTSNLSFNYNAPAAADMDGNTYIRYYDLNALNQDIKATLITLPIYMGYTFRIKHWLAVYANFGVSFGFKAGSNFKSVSGDGYVYGVYPEYGDLKIEESYLNGFGNITFENFGKKPVVMNNFTTSLLMGVGLEGRISGPLWINVGIKYNVGFSDIFKSSYKEGETFTMDNAPVTYTVAESEQVEPFTNYFIKSKLSMLSLNVGLSLKF